MYAAVTNDLIYEILKLIQSHVALMRDDLNNVEGWLRKFS